MPGKTEKAIEEEPTTTTAAADVGEIKFEVTGRAAHTRFQPLLPVSWMDINSTTNNNNNNNHTSSLSLSIPDFLWENAPKRSSRSYRDKVKCYSHMPNGLAVLDSKWALSRFLTEAAATAAEATATTTTTAMNKDDDLAILESHCLFGRTGFVDFCKQQHLLSTTDDGDVNEPLANDTRDNPGNNNSDLPKKQRFLDLLNDNKMNDATVKDNEESAESQEANNNNNMWVLKDANSNGAGGIWIISPNQQHHLIQELSCPKLSSLYEDHRYVIQKYAWPPVLYGGRKCHVRVYGLLTSDGRAFLHQDCFLHVANKPFDVSSSLDTVHITNCCANSHQVTEFAGEILASLMVLVKDDDEQQKDDVVDLSKFFPSMKASFVAVAQRAFPFIGGGHENGGMEYLGLDFILSESSSGQKKKQPVAYLLEINAPPSQDTATGLPHAEHVHDTVLKDLLHLWVYPNVYNKNVCVEQPGGWHQVYQHPMSPMITTMTTILNMNSHNSNNTDGPTSIVLPSKAVLYNKIQWAMYERRKQKEDRQRIKEFHDHVNRRRRMSSWIRRQFPYFDDNDPSCSPQIFMESAGGAQVPKHVIGAMKQSLSFRNRCTRGKKEQECAKETLRILLGATKDDYDIYLGQNATTLLQQLSYIVEQTLFSSTTTTTNGSERNEILLCTENHLANVKPWIALAERTGATIKWISAASLDKNDDNDMDSLWKRLLLTAENNDKTNTRRIVVALTHASNVLGTIRNVAKISHTIKQISPNNTIVVVDGVAAVPHVPAVLSKDVDWYVASLHKLFGPHMGVLVGRRRKKKKENDNDDEETECTKRTLPLSWSSLNGQLLLSTLEAGTQNYEACAGVAGLGRYFAELLSATSFHSLESNDDDLPQQLFYADDKESCKILLTPTKMNKAYHCIHWLEWPLIKRLYDELESNPFVRLLVTTTNNNNNHHHRLPLICFLHDNYSSKDIVKHCANTNNNKKNGIIICRSGTFLSTTKLRYEELGLLTKKSVDEEEVNFVRFSLAHYNTMDEVEHTLQHLETLPHWRK